MARICEDEHGRYVRAGGYLFRPVRPSRMRMAAVPYQPASRTGQPLLRGNAPDRHPTGANVAARHLPGMPMALVGDEVWFSHGDSNTWDRDNNRSRQVASRDLFER